jgi:hypothetical protein
MKFWHTSSSAMLDSGEVKSMAELARLGRVSWARITQIMDLLMLAPEIQERILCGGWAPSATILVLIADQVRWPHQRCLPRG